MITINYDFWVRMDRDVLNQYIVEMIEIDVQTGSIEVIEFIFDSGATYTQLNKDLAEYRGWVIFKNGLKLGSYIKDAPPTVFDLRKIPKLSFGIRQITDLVVATPVDGNVKVSNLLGRSFIDNFAHGVDPDAKKIYFTERKTKTNIDSSFGKIMRN